MGNIDTKERAEEAGLELFPSSMSMIFIILFYY